MMNNNNEPKISFARKGTNEWKFFSYMSCHNSVTSRESKYPPLEIMDLPKLISNLIREGYDISKINRTRINSLGVAKRYTEYYLNEKVVLHNV